MASTRAYYNAARGDVQCTQLSKVDPGEGEEEEEEGVKTEMVEAWKVDGVRRVGWRLPFWKRVLGRGGRCVAGP